MKMETNINDILDTVNSNTEFKISYLDQDDIQYDFMQLGYDVLDDGSHDDWIKYRFKKSAKTYVSKKSSFIKTATKFIVESNDDVPSKDLHKAITNAIQVQIIDEGMDDSRLAKQSEMDGSILMNTLASSPEKLDTILAKIFDDIYEFFTPIGEVNIQPGMFQHSIEERMNSAYDKSGELLENDFQTGFVIIDIDDKHIPIYTNFTLSKSTGGRIWNVAIPQLSWFGTECKEIASDTDELSKAGYGIGDISTIHIVEDDEDDIDDDVEDIDSDDEKFARQ